MGEPLFVCEVFPPWEPSRSHPGTVIIQGEHLEVRLAEGRTFALPWSGMTLSRGGFDGLAIALAATLPGDPPTGGNLHLQIQDEAFLNRLQAAGPGFLRPEVQRLKNLGRQSAWWETASRGALLATLLVLLAAGWLAVQYLAERSVDWIPPGLENTLGEATARGVMGSHRQLSSGPLYAAVRTVWDRVLAGLPPNPYQFRLYLVENETVNALAAPAGHVVVFTGLLGQLTSPEELAGILAHECSHALARHGLRTMLKSAGVTFSLGLVFGGSGDFGATFRKLGAELLTLRYSRATEVEADRGAVDILVRARIDPRRFPEFFTRMEDQQGGGSLLPAILSTHPLGKARLDALEERLARVATTTWNPIGVDWKALQSLLPPAPPAGP